MSFGYFGRSSPSGSEGCKRRIFAVLVMRPDDWSFQGYEVGENCLSFPRVWGTRGAHLDKHCVSVTGATQMVRCRTEALAALVRGSAPS